MLFLSCHFLFFLLTCIEFARIPACVSAFTAVTSTTRRHTSSSSSHTKNFPSSETSTRLFDITQQAEYGKSLPLPETYVKCGKCQTVYALQQSDLGEKGRGRRLGCSVCGHSWFQSKDRLLTLREGFEFSELPESDMERISQNINEGKSPGFTGEVKLYVGNIAFECHEDDLRALFETVGTVGDVSLVRDEEGKNRGFGFVTMRTNEEGDKALDELNGASIRGRNIAVRESNN